MKRRSKQKRLVIGLALAFGLVVFVAFLLLARPDQEHKNSAWVVHTGWGQPLMAQEGVPENVGRVISKPPKLAQLRAALAFCLQPESIR